jgi:hypothetical protein
MARLMFDSGKLPTKSDLVNDDLVKDLIEEGKKEATNSASKEIIKFLTPGERKAIAERLIGKRK